jgi:hypothetical protein
MSRRFNSIGLKGHTVRRVPKFLIEMIMFLQISHAHFDTSTLQCITPFCELLVISYFSDYCGGIIYFHIQIDKPVQIILI